MITIDKDVPMPSPAKPPPKYPWRSMAVGDSFFIAGLTVAKLASLAAWGRKATGYRFTCRTVTENGVAGVRVWRVE